MSTTIKIEGFEELKRSLKAFPSNVQKNILTSAVRAEATNIAKSAKQKVPVNTGNLKKAITVKKRRTKNKNNVKFSIGITLGKNAKYDGFYGHMVEFGTSKMAAQPFMRPAYEQLKDGAIENITKKMKQRLDKEIERSRNA